MFTRFVTANNYGAVVVRAVLPYPARTPDERAEPPFCMPTVTEILAREAAPIGTFWAGQSPRAPYQFLTRAEAG
jgi:hypothetical protein